MHFKLLIFIALCFCSLHAYTACGNGRCETGEPCVTPTCSGLEECGADCPVRSLHCSVSAPRSTQFCFKSSIYTTLRALKDTRTGDSLVWDRVAVVGACSFPVHITAHAFRAHAHNAKACLALRLRFTLFRLRFTLLSLCVRTSKPTQISETLCSTKQQAG